MLLLPTNDAKLIVVKKCGKGCCAAQVCRGGQSAHPVILDYGILIKDATTLALWDTDDS